MAARWVGTISPAGVTGFAEEDARSLFQSGNAAFMRNWPYAYALGQSEESVIAGKFDVASLPAGRSGHGAATLGGWQLAVSNHSNNPEIAADVALFMASPKNRKFRAIKGSFTPTIMTLTKILKFWNPLPLWHSLRCINQRCGSSFHSNCSQLQRSIYSLLPGRALGSYRG